MLINSISQQNAPCLRTKLGPNQREKNQRKAAFTKASSWATKKGDTYDNPCSYCYVARFGRQKLYVNTNTDELLAE
jgi:hypothetical protein